MKALSMGVDGNTLNLALRGEIDYGNASMINHAVRDAIAQWRPARLCVDLGEVTFLDSSGIGMLVAAMRAADEAGAVFAVQRPTPRVYDLLDLTGLVEVFGLADRHPGRAVDQ